MSGTRRRLSERRAQGFTLLELVIALTLLGLIMTLLFGGLRLGTRAWNSGTSHAEAVSEVHLVQDWIRRELSQARLIVWQTENGDQQLAFLGAATGVRFVAPLPAHRGGGGLHVLAIEVDDSRSGRRLHLRHQLYHPDTGGFEPTEESESVVLLDRIETAEFSYFGSLNDQDEPEWTTSWEGTTKLPQRIRLVVELPDDTPTDWPELIVAPMITSG